MKWVLSFAMIACIALTAPLWSRRMPAFLSDERQDVSTASGAEAAPASRAVQGIGYVEPVSEIRKLAFKVEGLVKDCPIDIGQWVAHGDVLMSLDDSEESAAVAVAEKKLATAVAEREQLLAGIHTERIVAAVNKLKRLKEAAAHARRHHERIAALHGNKSTTEAERDEAESALLQADAARVEADAELTAMQEHVRPVDRAVAEASVAQAQAQIAAARARLEQTVLRAPSDGRVLEILRRGGEASRGLQAEPVLIFADDSRLRVRAEIDERYVSFLHEGQFARVFGRGLGDRTYSGTVALVKRLMGHKTVFSRTSSERKDLDVLQILIDMPETFHAPLGLQVDVEVLRP